MAVITKDSKAELDLISQNQVQDISFEGYMIAHFMGITSRDERSLMYTEMLSHGINYRNDNLACTGLRGSLRHVFKEREVSDEGSAKILELPWDKAKEEEWFGQVELAIKLLEDVVTSLNIYSRGPTSRDGFMSTQFSIGLLKTWKFVIKELSYLCWIEKKFGECTGQVSQENLNAFCLYTKLGTTWIFRKAGKKQEDGDGYGYEHWHLEGAREDVIANLKDGVSHMPLERVIFWLKNHGDEMPDDFRKVFRIEFARKGGQFAY